MFNTVPLDIFEQGQQCYQVTNVAILVCFAIFSTNICWLLTTHGRGGARIRRSSASVCTQRWQLRHVHYVLRLVYTEKNPRPLCSWLAMNIWWGLCELTNPGPIDQVYFVCQSIYVNHPSIVFTTTPPVFGSGALSIAGDLRTPIHLPQWPTDADGLRLQLARRWMMH